MMCYKVVNKLMFHEIKLIWLIADYKKAAQKTSSGM